MKQILQRCQVLLRNRFKNYMKKLLIVQIWNIKHIYDLRQIYLKRLEETFTKNIKNWKKFGLTKVVDCNRSCCFMQKFERTLYYIKQRNLVNKFGLRVKQMYNFEDAIELKRTTVSYNDKPYIIKYCYDERINKVYVIGNSKSIQHTMFRVEPRSSQQQILELIEKDYSFIILESFIYESVEGKVKQQLRIFLYGNDINEVVSNFQMRFIKIKYNYWKTVNVVGQNVSYDVYYRVVNQKQYEGYSNTQKKFQNGWDSNEQQGKHDR